MVWLVLEIIASSPPPPQNLIFLVFCSFVLSAVSPAVVVPTLLSLKEKGYGESKGISTLVIAASSIDDIVAISAFGVVLGLVFSQGG